MDEEPQAAGLEREGVAPRPDRGQADPLERLPAELRERLAHGGRALSRLDPARQPAVQAEHRLLAAIHLRFGLPAKLPADLTALIKAADRNAAWLEATRLAGFADEEARKFFGAPPKYSAALVRDYLTPWPADTAETRLIERVEALLRAAQPAKHAS